MAKPVSICRSLRIFCVAVSCMLAYSSAPVGFNSAIGSLGSWIQKWSRKPGMYTDAPGRIYRGPHPGRDPKGRGGVWSPTALAAAEESELNANIDAELQLPPHSTPVAPESGNSYSWEGSASMQGAAGQINTGNGNKLTAIPLTSWKCKGGMTVDFTIYHNSQSNYNDELGQHWSWTYDIYINFTSDTATVHWGNGLCIPYAIDTGGGTTGTTGGTGVTTGATGATTGSTTGGDAGDQGLYASEYTTTYTAPAGIYDTLVGNVDGTYTVTKKDQTKYHFNTSGFCDSVTDRNGNTISITLNGSNYATAITDPTGRQITISVSSNKFTSITDPDGHTWSFTLSSGNLSTVTWPTLGGTSYTDTFSYDTGHAITTHTDRRGKSWTSTYNSSDESLASDTDPNSHTTSYSYTSSATTITDPLSHSMVDNYSSGQLSSRVDQASYTNSYTYNSSHNVLTHTDGRSKVWTNTWDSHGNRLTVEDPLSHTWTWTYNSINEPLTVTDPLSHVTTYTYDTPGNLLTITDGLSHTRLTNTYNGAGQLLTSTDALSNETDYTYDSDGNLETITDPLSHTTTLSYDGMSRLTSAEDPLTHTESIDYDVWGRPTTYTHDDSTTKAVAYNAVGQVTQTTDENSHSTTYAYDDAGRLTSVTNANSEVESYGYDNANRRTTVTNGRSYTRTYAYTNRGEIYTLTMPDSTVETWSHNGNGDVTAYTNQLSQTINYSYDDAGRQTGIDYPTGTDPTFSYDNANRRTSMVDSTGTSSWTYNAADEVTELDTPQGNMTYTYYNDGRRHTMVEGSGTTTYSYDAAGRMTSLVNPYSETTSWTYDNANRVTRQTFNTGAYTAYGYDDRNRVTSLDHKNSSNVGISSESYTYDDASNLATKTVDSVTTTYGYDDIDQLTSESRSGYSASYSYDANGNRATKALGGTTDTYHYNNCDELTYISQGGVTTKSYTYDDAGRTTAVTVGSDTTSLAYDYEGRLTTITYPSTATNTFTYNALDTRVGKVDSGGTFTYKRDGVGVTDPVLSDGSAAYTPGISERRSSTSKFYHEDPLGSVSRILNTSQTTTDTKQYDAFGNMTSTTGSTPTPFGFAGGARYQGDPDSGLMLVGRRYYDASSGRFITRDSKKRARNWYTYCANNPLNRVDPSGNEWKWSAYWDGITSTFGNGSGSSGSGVDGPPDWQLGAQFVLGYAMQDGGSEIAGSGVIIDGVGAIAPYRYKISANIAAIDDLDNDSGAWGDADDYNNGHGRPIVENGQPRPLYSP